MNVVGIDVGYSNLKVAYGPHDGRPNTFLRPAGAAPSDRFGMQIDGQRHPDYVDVLVRDEDYIAGVSSDRAELWSRSLHEDYPATDSYMALFHAGLLMTGLQYVEMLVTGLPVSQYFNEEKRKALVSRLKGPHRVTRKRDVIVGDVRVIPQPVGGLLDYIDQRNVDLDDARVLIIDPGFFSLDWLVLYRGAVQRHASGTSLNASSVMLSTAAELIHKDGGSPVSPDTLEDALRRGKSHILVKGNPIAIAEYISAASAKLATTITNEIRMALRKETQAADLVVLVGGGASFYRDILVNTFDGIRVDIPDNPVFSNARGFWTMGASK